MIYIKTTIKLQFETLFLAVGIFDQVIFSQIKEYDYDEKQILNKMKLVSVGSLLVASKLEEVYNIPSSENLALFARCSKQEILDIESSILLQMNFDLMIVTSVNFATVLIFENNYSKSVKDMVQRLLILTIQEYQFTKYLPLVLCVAAIQIATKQHQEPSLSNQKIENLQINTNILQNCQKYLESIQIKEFQRQNCKSNIVQNNKRYNTSVQYVRRII